MVDHKISEFPVATTLADADLLTLLHGGVNQIITWANAKATVFTALFTNASDFPIDADATSAGDRSVTFTLTATTFVRLLWNSSLSIFQLVNNAGTLQKLAIANGTASTHAVTKAQLDTEVNARIGADNALVAAQVFTESFTSTNQTINLGGNITLPHGLSSIPILVMVSAINVSGTTQSGYADGKEIILNPGYTLFNSSIQGGLAVVIDSTDIVVVFSTGSIPIVDSSGAASSVNDPEWELIVRAYA